MLLPHGGEHDAHVQDLHQAPARTHEPLLYDFADLVSWQ